MELKKTPEADLQNRRVLFMEIGLVAALLFVVGAFMWGQSEKKIEKIDMQVGPVEQEVVIDTRQDVKPPEIQVQEVQILSDFINVVKNDASIKTDYKFNDFGDDFVIEIPDFVPADVEEIPVFVAEEPASFRGGGLDVFRGWVFDQLVYPQEAQENGAQGTVVLQFVIETDGRLTNITERSSPHPDLTTEAIRVLRMSPRWTAAKNRNRPVRQYFILPISFQLSTT